MVNTLKIYNKALLQGLMKLAGVRPQTIEIESGIIMNFWVPNETTTNKFKAHNESKNNEASLFWSSSMASVQMVLALAKHYSVYVPDLLFFGDSVTDKSERSVEFQAECMVKGLKKLGVEKCTLVGFSYGGIVGFKMAEMHPHLVESMVVTGSVMALTNSISIAALQRIGFSSWADYLLPDSVKGLKMLLKLGSYKLPWIPHCIYKDFLEVMFNNRKEKVELLEALVISDQEFVIPPDQQRIHILWGKDDKIFDLDTASNMKMFLKKILASQFLEDTANC
ncbi:hypothetical protein REPUB_Repub01dG0211000 [Reevesia pubescens]